LRVAAYELFGSSAGSMEVEMEVWMEVEMGGED
jgi:hypothetical protein